jgi:hypothetical protein
VVLLLRWACRAGTRDFYPDLAALVSPGKKNFLTKRTLFHFVSPSPSNLGQAVVLGRPSLSLCLLVLSPRINSQKMRIASVVDGKKNSVYIFL